MLQNILLPFVSMIWVNLIFYMWQFGNLKNKMLLYYNKSFMHVAIGKLERV
jgi:hypothetical protein